MSSNKYKTLDTTDNFTVGNNLIHDDNDDDDDIFITPDVENTKSNTFSKPSNSESIPQSTINTSSQQTQQSPQSNNNNNNNNNNSNGNGTQFFNLSSFITPQLPSFVQIETRERPFTGGNTLDESVITTLQRDLITIGNKLLSILWPLRLRQSLISVKKISNRFSINGGDVEDSIDNGNVVNNNNNNNNTNDDTVIADNIEGSNDEYSSETMGKIRDWDLWGPLIINLGFSLIITYLQTRSLNTSGGNNSNDINSTSSQTFSAAFTLIWASLSVLSINIQLLSPVQQKLENGSLTNGVIGLSFFQCVSLLSYALFPIMLGGMFSIFIPFKFIRLILNIIMLMWSLLCTWLIMAIASNCKRRGSLTFISNNNNDDDDGDNNNESDQRIFLMVYPVFLVFGLFSWFCVIV
ncbi:hypothetical protein C6P40_002191 [Pichia californica]|uniref:Yip1 domain-containing protein n=1 Tax=Pichia californica TaxID=460514 RepID=A0A9P6WI26_9ASCO|nr:hypothetical protein C6P42_002239 [[Candida] californica]KAG0687555.1 hypothetical protein C6P40_002191 [[Candida] californica]